MVFAVAAREVEERDRKRGGEREGRREGGKEGGRFEIICGFYTLFTAVAGELEGRERRRGGEREGRREGEKEGGREGGGGRKREPVGLKRLIIRTDATWCGSGKIRSNFKRHGFL